MPIDPSIALNVKPFQAPDQLTTLAKIMQLQGAQQQISLGDMQMQKFNRDVAEEDATKIAMAAYAKDPTAVSLADLAAANPKAYQAIVKLRQETKKSDAEISKNEAETRVKNLEFSSKRAERLANILSSAKDQPTYELAIAAAKGEFGEAVAQGVPQRFDPTWLAAKTREALSLKDRIDLQLKDDRLAFDKDAKKVDQGIALGNLNVARGNLSVNQGRLAEEKNKNNRELTQPEGAPFEVTNKETGDKVLVMRTKSGTLLDANTKQPIAFTAGPKSPDLGVDGAGRVALLQQGKQDIQEAKGILFNEKGEMRRATVAAMNVPFTAGVGTDARKAYSRILNSIGGKLRAETGAAAPDSEVKNIAERFMPTQYDTSESAKDKMDRLEEFMTMPLRELERSGYLAPGTADAKRSKAPSISDLEAELAKRKKDGK